jgi:hypothetical protein
MANIAPLLQYLDIPGMRGAAAAQLTPWAHTPPPMQFSGLSPDMATMQNARADIGSQPPRYQPPLPIINQPINPPPLPWFAYAGGQALPPNDRIPAPPQRPGMAPETSVTAPGGLPQGNFNPQPSPAQVEVDEQVGGMDPRRGIQPRTDQGFGSYQPSAADFGEKQAKQSPFSSDAGMWGILAAGLGILANNYGNYGQAGPAIGKGGMMGLNTFLEQRQIAERNKFAQQELDQRNAQIQQAGDYQRSMMRQGDRRLGMEEEAYKQKEAQALATRNLALQLAGNDPEQQRIAVANPDKYLDFKVAQLKPDYKQREIKEGTQAYDEYSIDGGKTWNKIPGGGKYDLKAAKGGTDISLKVGEKQGEAFTKPIAEQVDASFTKAMSAVESQKTLEGFRQRLNDPRLISGAGANVRLAVEQVSQLFGGDGADLAATRDVIQGLAELTINSRGMLKGQGQVTEYEQKTLEKARSGDISLTVPELKALVNVFTRMNKAQYDAHGSTMRRLAKIKGGEQALEFYQPDPFPGAEQAPSGGKPWEREDIK